VSNSRIPLKGRTHWGVYSVPAFGSEWYPRQMHFEGKSEYKHHVETYGKGSKTFYHSHYPLFDGQPPTSEDPELRLLYGNVPEQEWLEKIWLGKLKEVIDKYQPDIIWFDSWLDQIPEDHRKRFAAYYLNAAKKWDKEVVIARKQTDLPLDFTINDHEKTARPSTRSCWVSRKRSNEGPAPPRGRKDEGSCRCRAGLRLLRLGRNRPRRQRCPSPGGRISHLRGGDFLGVTIKAVHSGQSRMARGYGAPSISFLS